MTKWPMRGHFRYLRFKNFPMTPKTLQCELFWALLLNSKHSGVPEDSKSPTLEVLGFTPTFGQSGVATFSIFLEELLTSMVYMGVEVIACNGIYDDGVKASAAIGVPH